MADNGRYKLLNTELENNFLMGKQEYPTTILASKRLMTDFQPTGGSVGGTHNQKDRPEPTNFAFVQTKRTTGGFKPICYCCGKRCNTGGWRECPNVTQQQIDRMTKLVEKGHFEWSSGGGNNNSGSNNNNAKKGLRHTKVEEQETVEEDNEPSNEEYPSISSLIKMNGFINVNAAADCDNVNHRVRGQCHSFDGDKVSDLGFLQFEKDVSPTNQYQGVVLADAGEWLIQGRRGSNPTKIQRPGTVSPAKKTTPSVSDTEDIVVRIQKCTQKKVTALTETTMTELRYRVTLDPWKLYLDRCATYHTFFVKEFLARVQKGKATITGSCNAGTTSTNT